MERLRETVCILDRTGSTITRRTEVTQLWRYQRLSSQARHINSAVLKEEESRSRSTALKTWCASMTTVQLTYRTGNTKGSNGRAENFAKTSTELDALTRLS